LRYATCFQLSAEARARRCRGRVVPVRARASHLRRAGRPRSGPAAGGIRTQAVFTTIGGEDELKVLPHLDPDLLASHPKPFFGYSDNNNLHLFLWNLGLVSYQGGAIMVQFGRPARMHPVTRDSLLHAVFSGGPRVLEPAAEYGDQEHNWADPQALAAEPPMFASRGWSWHGPPVSVTGPSWGGCLEIVDFHLRTGRYLLPDDEYEGAVLFLETSEELASADYVYRVLMCMGERRLLQRFGAVIWGRPKAWSFERPNDPEAKALTSGTPSRSRSSRSAARSPSTARTARSVPSTRAVYWVTGRYSSITRREPSTRLLTSSNEQRG
jgi:muramoyltetrapeptide carboxypeptidase LdcA involved in peptidoglycan recycling